MFAGADDLVLTRLSAAALDAEAFDSIRIRQLGTESLTVFVGKQNPLYPSARRGQSLDPSCLADCDWVLPPGSTEVRQNVDELLVLCGLAPPVPLVEVASLHSLLMMVGTSRAVGAGPLSAVRRMADQLKLAPLNLHRFKPEKTPIVAMYHLRQEGNPPMPLFLDSLMQARSAIGMD